MVKQHIHHNTITLSGKANEIKKALHALVQSDSGKATVAQYVWSRTKGSRKQEMS